MTHKPRRAPQSLLRHETLADGVLTCPPIPGGSRAELCPFRESAPSLGPSLTVSRGPSARPADLSLYTGSAPRPPRLLEMLLVINYKRSSRPGARRTPKSSASLISCSLLLLCSPIHPKASPEQSSSTTDS